ncbi:MAG: DUF2461 domain-containing protein [Chitinophagaceae bacterium]|nr:DUF2461 domain-containing protein [Chitinophagaceae bacterium]MCW5904363.1 DUF2461 domain-containing protein [Chitinophagaceae bacterium]
MLQPTTIQFLKNLKKNNHKEWFEKNRTIYETAKADYLLFIEKVLHELKKKDTTLEGVEAKKCVFRINRDVRFSKDKSPYKTNMGASFSKGGKKTLLAGYYFHAEPGQSFIAGGLWMPMAAELQKVRQEIDYNANEFHKMITAKKLITQFGGLEKNKEYVLTRPPKGYDINNAAIEYLKFKSFIVLKNIADKELTEASLLKNIVTSFETMIPFIHFLNRALED